MQTELHLHGGIIPVVATFFVFSDYMKPAIRLSCIQELPVKFVWTHDAFRVGEDGPTHQPVEQEAQIRLLEKLKNHSHEQNFRSLTSSGFSRNQCCLENGDGKFKILLQDLFCPDKGLKIVTGTNRK